MAINIDPAAALVELLIKSLTTVEDLAANLAGG